MNEIDEMPPPQASESASTAEPGARRADDAAKPDAPQGTTPPAGKPTGGLTDRESIIETVKTVVYALLIALVIRTFLFQPFNIPSGSMEATLLVGDYVFVEKFAYGYSRYSFPWGLGPIPHGRIWPGDGPKRGDVIVFKLPSDTSIDYIKRIIGLPGDRIQLIHGIVYLNGKPLPRQRIDDYVDNDTYNDVDPQDPLVPGGHYTRYRETLPGGKSYNIMVLDTEGVGQNNNTGVYVVPAGHYFMMGDNRDDSLDSRFWPEGDPFIHSGGGGVGYVPAQNLVGKAVIVFFSDDSALWEFWRWPWSLRFSRFFKIVH